MVKVYSAAILEDIANQRGLPIELLSELKNTAAVMPFKTNRYILNELIDWRKVPDDPVFNMNFPKPGILGATASAHIEELCLSGADSAEIDTACQMIRRQLVTKAMSRRSGEGVPTMDGKPIVGVFHNFAHTAFLFPDAMKTCFAYCNYCMRWAKHLGVVPDFTYREPHYPVSYLRANPQISDVIFSGGDALNTPAEQLRRFVEPLMSIGHISTIRFSTRAFSWWPDRFVSDADADEVLALFEELISYKKHVAVMAHLTHPAELATPTVEQAVSRVRRTGAVIRGQGPLLKGVNDTPEVLAALWRSQVRLGIVPYYLFLESQQGLMPVHKIPLTHALHVFKEAQRQVGGLAKTVRGPVLNSYMMKIQIDNIFGLNGREQLLLKCLQSSNPEEMGRAAVIDPGDATDERIVSAFRSNIL